MPKHNKRRNTAFLFEVLVHELTVSTLKKDDARKATITSIIKSHFNKGSVLARELHCYRGILESSGIDPYTFEKIIIESKRAYAQLDLSQIFKAQSALAADINQKLSKDVYSTFIPNYKQLATISTILNPVTPIKKKILFEKTLLESVSQQKEPEVLQPVDNLVFKTFVKKFNETYAPKLLDEQKALLRVYIGSISDDVPLKLFLNEEIGRLKTELLKFSKTASIKEDVEIKSKIEQVRTLVESETFSKEIDAEVILNVLKIQQLTNDLSKTLLES